MYRSRIGLDAQKPGLVRDSNKTKFRAHHEKRLAEISKRVPGTGTVDNSAPYTASLMHLKTRPRKRAMIAARDAQVERANRDLLRQMARIFTSPSFLLPVVQGNREVDGRGRAPVCASINVLYRKRELERIVVENRQMVKHLAAVSSSYKATDWRRDRVANKKLAQRLRVVRYERQKCGPEEYSRRGVRNLRKEIERTRGKAFEAGYTPVPGASATPHDSWRPRSCNPDSCSGHISSSHSRSRNRSRNRSRQDIRGVTPCTKRSKSAGGGKARSSERMRCRSGSKLRKLLRNRSAGSSEEVKTVESARRPTLIRCHTEGKNVGSNREDPRAAEVPPYHQTIMPTSPDSHLSRGATAMLQSVKTPEELQVSVRPMTARPGIDRARTERQCTEFAGDGGLESGEGGIRRAARKEGEEKGFSELGGMSDAGSDYSAYRSDEFEGEDDTSQYSATPRDEDNAWKDAQAIDACGNGTKKADDGEETMNSDSSKGNEPDGTAIPSTTRAAKSTPLVTHLCCEDDAEVKSTPEVSRPASSRGAHRACPVSDNACRDFAERREEGMGGGLPVAEPQQTAAVEHPTNASTVEWDHLSPRDGSETLIRDMGSPRVGYAGSGGGLEDQDCRSSGAERSEDHSSAVETSGGNAAIRSSTEVRCYQIVSNKGGEEEDLSELGRMEEAGSEYSAYRSDAFEGEDDESRVSATSLDEDDACSYARAINANVTGAQKAAVNSDSSKGDESGGVAVLPSTNLAATSTPSPTSLIHEDGDEEKTTSATSRPASARGARQGGATEDTVSKDPEEHGHQDTEEGISVAETLECNDRRLESASNETLEDALSVKLRPTRRPSRVSIDDVSDEKLLDKTHSVDVGDDAREATTLDLDNLGVGGVGKALVCGSGSPYAGYSGNEGAPEVREGANIWPDSSEGYSSAVESRERGAVIGSSTHSRGVAKEEREGGDLSELGRRGEGGSEYSAYRSDDFEAEDDVSRVSANPCDENDAWNGTSAIDAHYAGAQEGDDNKEISTSNVSKTGEQAGAAIPFGSINVIRKPSFTPLNNEQAVEARSISAGSSVTSAWEACRAVSVKDGASDDPDEGEQQGMGEGLTISNHHERVIRGKDFTSAMVASEASGDVSSDEPSPPRCPSEVPNGDAFEETPLGRTRSVDVAVDPQEAAVVESDPVTGVGDGGENHIGTRELARTGYHRNNSLVEVLDDSNIGPEVSGVYSSDAVKTAKGAAIGSSADDVRLIRTPSVCSPDNEVAKTGEATAVKQKVEAFTESDDTHVGIYSGALEAADAEKPVPGPRDEYSLNGDDSLTDLKGGASTIETTENRSTNALARESKLSSLENDEDDPSAVGSMHRAGVGGGGSTVEHLDGNSSRSHHEEYSSSLGSPSEVTSQGSKVVIRDASHTNQHPPSILLPKDPEERGDTSTVPVETGKASDEGISNYAELLRQADEPTEAGPTEDKTSADRADLHFTLLNKAENGFINGLNADPPEQSTNMGSSSLVRDGTSSLPLNGGIASDGSRYSEFASVEDDEGEGSGAGTSTTLVGGGGKHVPNGSDADEGKECLEEIFADGGGQGSRIAVDPTVDLQQGCGSWTSLSIDRRPEIEGSSKETAMKSRESVPTRDGGRDIPVLSSLPEAETNETARAEELVFKRGGEKSSGDGARDDSEGNASVPMLRGPETSIDVHNMMPKVEGADGYGTDEPYNSDFTKEHDDSSFVDSLIEVDGERNGGQSGDEYSSDAGKDGSIMTEISVCVNQEIYNASSVEVAVLSPKTISDEYSEPSLLSSPEETNEGSREDRGFDSRGKASKGSNGTLTPESSAANGRRLLRKGDLKVKGSGRDVKDSAEMNVVGIGIKSVEVNEGDEAVGSSAAASTVVTGATIKEENKEEDIVDEYASDAFDQESSGVDVVSSSTVVARDVEGELEIEEPGSKTALATTHNEGLVSRDVTSGTINSVDRMSSTPVAYSERFESE